MMMRRSFSAMLGVAFSAATFVGIVAMTEDKADACGGCFHPVGDNPTVVTDHRMIFSISKEQSTLYDQIRYTGSPSSFAWVLPISGTVEVGLSADVVFSTLDRLTQTSIMPPPMNCPAPPTNCRGGGFSAGSSDAGVSAPGVGVIKKEVVGPYETVQLSATDTDALKNWLATNGYAVPPDVAPIIDAYVGEHFNFLALKLAPGQGVQDMRPVRVTTQGANVALPLRMVAAGAGANLGISLWIISEGRYEPQNFASFYIKTEELKWTWAQNRSNYTELRAEKTAAGNGRIWETESSLALGRAAIEQGIQQGSFFPGQPFQDAGGDYAPVVDPDGGAVTKTPTQVREEDLATLFAGISESSARVTRLRADLAKTALDQDLVMRASDDQAVLQNVRQAVNESDQPQCPVFNGCEQTGTLPRDEAIKASATNISGGGSTFACSTTPYRSAWLSVATGLGVIALAQGIRRRRRK